MQFDDEDFRQFEKQFDLKRSDSDEAKAPAQKKGRLDDREKLSLKRSYSKTPDVHRVILVWLHQEYDIQRSVGVLINPLQSLRHRNVVQTLRLKSLMLMSLLVLRILSVNIPRNRSTFPSGGHGN